jgi:outer membrane protein assembly factor BamB
VNVYRYHLTPDFPYTIGCLRGKPSRDWRISATAAPAAPAPGPVPTVTTTPTPPAPPTAPPQVSASPDLYPQFDPNVSDYVTRCVAGQPVTVQINAPTGTTIAVDGQPARGGSYSVPVTVATGQRFDFTVDESGTAATYHVRCLPPDFPSFTAQRTGTPQAQWYVIAPALSGTGTLPPSYVALFDDDGVPVWWFNTTDGAAMDAKLLPDGTLAYARTFGGGFGKDPRIEYEIRSLDGTLRTTLQTSGTTTDSHDLQQLPNGDYLMDSYVPRDHVDLSPYGGPQDATVLDGEIQELKPDGTLVWTWNSKDHISLDETGRWYQHGALTPNTLPDGRTAYDIVHLNSVEPNGNALLVSFRHLDALYAIDRTTGDILWKLGGTQTAQSLSISGDPDSAADFGGQHDARVLADGTVTVFDDGTFLNRAPRDVRFSIDTTAKTATLAESITDTGAPTSGCCGSARKLAGGDWVTSWGSTPLVTEATPTGQRVLAIQFSGGPFTYRAVPVTSGTVDAATLRGDMDAMNPRP